MGATIYSYCANGDDDEKRRRKEKRDDERIIIALEVALQQQYKFTRSLFDVMDGKVKQLKDQISSLEGGIAYLVLKEEVASKRNKKEKKEVKEEKDIENNNNICLICGTELSAEERYLEKCISCNLDINKF